MSKDLSVSRDDRLLAGLAYPFWPLVFLLVYLTPEKRAIRFLRYHSYQGFFMGLALWGGGVLVRTLAAFLGRNPLFGLMLYPLVKLLGWLSLLAVLYAMLMAWRGQYVKIPFVTDFALPFIDEEKSMGEEDSAMQATGRPQ
ncbi:MAG: hypothetical protein AMXMBFR33_33750 [Candidatus Xenobia bacterium]